MKTRPVKIVTKPELHCHFVSYQDRQPGQRYCAAQFDSRHTTLPQVKEWIALKPELRLVEE